MKCQQCMHVTVQTPGTVFPCSIHRSIDAICHKRSLSILCHLPVRLSWNNDYSHKAPRTVFPHSMHYNRDLTLSWNNADCSHKPENTTPPAVSGPGLCDAASHQHNLVKQDVAINSPQQNWCCLSLTWAAWLGFAKYCPIVKFLLFNLLSLLLVPAAECGCCAVFYNTTSRTVICTLLHFYASAGSVFCWWLMEVPCNHWTRKTWILCFWSLDCCLVSSCPKKCVPNSLPLKCCDLHFPWDQPDFHFC